ncbi:CC0125/CC1285 family lipoprotein [Litorimonas sp. RW-G-Af-16]|uniref:CC0125/CC1285 family lipoprotein n=1 Tax=Litorimonas sp. RW-G-Af-16 TaxID=3241168 RepID=UPI00390C9D97
MKKLLLLSAVLVISGCATGPTTYGPSDGGSQLGFSNTRIEQDRFRISYTARSANEARDFALRRAAEIAEAEGYSHFKVLSGGTYEDNRRSGVSSSIGIGTSSGGYRRGGTSVGVGIGINDVARALQGKRITEEIEVRLLQSVTGTKDANVFSAGEVLQNIRPEVFALEDTVVRR